ncbi:hypothetical protein [Flammeovirga sp. EKP202]|uniref:hypothetical protein n=1 Tax=Flammeovirga sp. EKP202 TaxID=2770592 RepID=UPI00165F097D|nr:hypothetical protein [Flammeovirga sp. EKP202]MBD0403792.1 hypothetical protein [Flammeovirga sp. EKP202]
MIKTIMVALGAAFFIIGVHQSFYYGIVASYWLFALAGICVLTLQFLQKKEEEQQKQSAPTKKSKPNNKKKSKKRK